jgi:hypothetical protein
VTPLQPNFGRVCCDLESPIQHLYAKIYAFYYNCVQTSLTILLYPAYKLINLRIFNTTGLFFRLKRLKKDPFLVHNSCGARPAAPASDDQQMQLWTLAPRGLTRLARPLCITLLRPASCARGALPANRTIHLYAAYIILSQRTYAAHGLNTSDHGKAVRRKVNAISEAMQETMKATAMDVRRENAAASTPAAAASTARGMDTDLSTKMRSTKAEIASALKDTPRDIVSTAF